MELTNRPERAPCRPAVFLRLALALLVVALAACALPPNAANDHPYRRMPSGPDNY